jgi:hypothetical protein
MRGGKANSWRPGYELKPELVEMTISSKLAVLLSSIATCLLLTGCFSNTMEDIRTSTPTVESSSVVGLTPTAKSDEDLVQRQCMTIYLDPWILGSR